VSKTQALCCVVQDGETAEEMDVDQEKQELASPREPLAELAQAEKPSSTAEVAAADSAGAEKPAADADEPVSDTDDEGEGEFAKDARMLL